jgi:hypothetical protein
MGAPVVIRRGHDIIYVHQADLAHDVVFGIRSDVAQESEDCISRMAKRVLGLLEVEAGRSFQGLGQALACVRHRLDSRAAKRIRGLHEAAGLVRHLTVVGEKAFLAEVSSSLTEVSKYKEDVHDDLGKDKGKGNDDGVIDFGKDKGLDKALGKNKKGAGPPGRGLEGDLVDDVTEVGDDFDIGLGTSFVVGFDAVLGYGDALGTKDHIDSVDEEGAGPPGHELEEGLVDDVIEIGGPLAEDRGKVAGVAFGSLRPHPSPDPPPCLGSHGAEPDDPFVLDDPWATKHAELEQLPEPLAKPELPLGLPIAAPEPRSDSCAGDWWCESCGCDIVGEYFFHFASAVNHCRRCHASCSSECMPCCWPP